MPEPIVSGDEAVVDNAVVDSAVVDDQSAVVDDAAVDNADGAQDGAADDQSDQQHADGIEQTAVVGPEKFRGLIESLKKTDPMLAKEVKNLVFAAEALKKEIPGGLPAIREMKAIYDDLGGKEGVEGIKAQRAEWEEIDNKYKAGDVSVLDHYIKFNPEGFAKLIPAGIDKLATVDRDVYNHTLSGPFVATLDSWRFADRLERLTESLSRFQDGNGNPQFANELKLLGDFAKQYESLREMASKLPQKKTESEDQKIAAQRAELAQERAKVAADYVGQNTANYAAKKYAEFIPVEARNRKFDVEKLKSIDYGEGQGTAYDRFQREIDGEVAQLVRSDTATVKKIQDSIAAGRKDDATKLSNSKFDAVYQTAVKRVVMRWATTFNPKGASSKANAGAAATTEKPTPGVKQLSEAPDTNLIDKSDPDWRNNFLMNSTAKLKTGQRVKW